MTEDATLHKPWAIERERVLKKSNGSYLHYSIW